MNMTREVENFILDLADIVEEVRYLRKEVKRLREVEKEYSAYLEKTYQESQRNSAELLKACLVAPLVKANERDEAEKILKIFDDEQEHGKYDKI